MLSEKKYLGREYVDLGLPSGLLWATTNVGANEPYESGNFYAWGEVESKSKFTWRNYKWCNGSEESLTKYCANDNGSIDYKTILELSDDVANVVWGGNWRIPTAEEQMELIDNCEWKFEYMNGFKGYRVIGPNKNTIFLPLAGYRSDDTLWAASGLGIYSSSTINWKSSELACVMEIREHEGINECGSGRDIGLVVRPVLDKKLLHNVMFDSNGASDIINSVVIKPIEIIHGGLLRIPENPYIRSGYNFISWNTKNDGSGANYYYNDIISVGTNITLYAQWYKSEIGRIHEYVDLGLSVKWSTCNVGARSPEDYGFCFAWGETKPKAHYLWNTYNLCKGGYKSLLKYCNDKNYGIYDRKKALDLSDDAANVNWGGNWRMPTINEIEELYRKCTWIWVTINNVKGYKIISKVNGNSIFLPAAGIRDDSKYNLLNANKNGFYLSCNLFMSQYYDDPSCVHGLCFGADFIDVEYMSGRNEGLSIRPVMP